MITLTGLYGTKKLDRPRASVRPAPSSPYTPGADAPAAVPYNHHVRAPDRAAEADDAGLVQVRSVTHRVSRLLSLYYCYPYYCYRKAVAAAGAVILD
jgi:hypothetical protein